MPGTERAPWRGERGCSVPPIFAEDDVTGNEANFAEINALWFQHRGAARAKIVDRS